mgnify:CR=1 FL=1
MPVNIDPLSAIGSFGGSLVSMIGQNKAIKKQIAAQKEENEKTRQYNLMLARQQNQWNIEQWQRENDYNSPSAQMARFREAGLNPDLMYGNGTAGNSMGSPALTSGAPATPQDMSPLGGMRNFGDVIQNTLNQEMQRAQIEAIKANTNKTKEETSQVIAVTDGIKIDNLYKAAKEQKTLDYMDVQIRVGKSVENLNKGELDKLSKEMNVLVEQASNLVKQREQIDATIRNLDADTQFKLADNIRKDKELKQFIENSYYQNKELLSRYNLNLQQYSEMCQTFALRYCNLAADTDSKDLTSQILQFNRNSLAIDFEVKDLTVGGVLNAPDYLKLPVLYGNEVLKRLPSLIPVVK